MESGISSEVLIIIDMQPFFLKNHDFDKEINGICKISKKFSSIVLVEYIGYENNDTISEIKQSIFPNAYRLVDKDVNNGAPEIMKSLPELRNLTLNLCGVYADYCVTDTANGLIDYNCKVNVISDLCGSWGNESNKFRFLSNQVGFKQESDYACVS